MNTFNILAPIILITAVGWSLRASGFLAKEFFLGMNRLTYYVALPCLLFMKISQPAVGDGQATAWPVALVVLGAMGICALSGYAVCRLLGLQGGAMGVVVQAGFRGNLAYVGLPVVLFALGATPSANGTDWGRVAALAIGPVVPAYNLLSIVVLMGGRERWTPGSIGRIVGQALSNPLVIACAIGVVFSTLALPLPLVVTRAGNLLAQMAAPLALLSIGASLTRRGIARSRSPALAAALVKVVMAPLAGWAGATWLGLGPEQARMALIFCACPTAVASYVLAQQLGGDEDIAAGAVMISTLLSALSLAAVISV